MIVSTCDRMKEHEDMRAYCEHLTGMEILQVLKNNPEYKEDSCSFARNVVVLTNT